MAGYDLFAVSVAFMLTMLTVVGYLLTPIELAVAVENKGSDHDEESATKQIASSKASEAAQRVRRMSQAFSMDMLNKGKGMLNKGAPCCSCCPSLMPYLSTYSAQFVQVGMGFSALMQARTLFFVVSTRRVGSTSSQQQRMCTCTCPSG